MTRRTGDADTLSGVEARLRRSEEHCRLVLEALPAAVILVDRSGRIERINRRAERLFGRDRAGLIGRPIGHLISGRDDDLASLVSGTPPSRPSGETSAFYGRRDDGSVFPIDVAPHASGPDPDDPTILVVGDPTETARTSAALEASERQLQVLVRGIEDYAIFMLDPTGHVLSWNAGAEKIKLYRAEEIIGRHFSCFYPATDIAAGKPDRELRVAATEGRLEDIGWRLRRDGTRFWANVVITASRDPNGRLLGFAKIIRDITDRRHSDERRFRRVVEAAPNGMVMVNADGRIELVNVEAERMFGYVRTELVGRPIEDLVPARFGVHHAGLRAGFMADPQARRMGAGRDLYGVRRDGIEFPIEIGLNPIETEDGPMVLSAIVDISDRKHKEERIQAALREKDLLLGEIHHRVKNNLQIVESLLELQSGRIGDPALLAMLRESQNRIRSMALIHQALYQSQDFAEVDFGQFLDRLTPILLSTYRTEPAKIDLVLDAARVSLPIGAAIPCGLIVNELMSNALKHGFPDGRAGTVRLHLTRDEANMVELDLSDDGIGIPAAIDLDNIGTLGLQLVPLLASQLHGTLTIERANPTRFRLRFPSEG